MPRASPRRVPCSLSKRAGLLGQAIQTVGLCSPVRYCDRTSHGEDRACRMVPELGAGMKARADRRSKYWAAWVRAKGGAPQRGDRLSPNVFTGRHAIVRVEDTSKSHDRDRGEGWSESLRRFSFRPCAEKISASPLSITQGRPNKKSKFAAKAVEWLEANTTRPLPSRRLGNWHHCP